MGVDEIGVDEMVSRPSGNKPVFGVPAINPVTNLFHQLPWQQSLMTELSKLVIHGMFLCENLHV